MDTSERTAARTLHGAVVQGCTPTSHTPMASCGWLGQRPERNS